MRTLITFSLSLLLFLLTACSSAAAPPQATPKPEAKPPGQTQPTQPEKATSKAEAPTTAAKAQPAPVIIDKPIKITEKRQALIREYAKINYGLDLVTIDPKVVIVHWTVSNDWESVYQYFYNETMPEDGGSTLNVSSQFLVARDGTIYRLTPETLLNRHAIGYNWCAIGIENVGGVDGKEDLTAAQLQANIQLIRYLKGKYPGIQYVWGHYQQNDAKASGLFIEKIPDYYADKIDPGPSFMAGLHQALSQDGLKFYEE